MFVRGIAALLGLGLVLSAEAAEMRVTEVGPYQLESSIEWISARRVNMRAEVTIPSYPARVWAVITDYENLSEFVPNITYSHVVLRQPKLILLQKGHLRVPPYFHPVEAVFELEENPPNTLSFRIVRDVREIPGASQRKDPDFLVYDGFWGLRPVEGGVRLIYQTTVEPNFWMPRWVIIELQRHVLKVTFRAIIKRCLVKDS